MNVISILFCYFIKIDWNKCFNSSLIVIWFVLFFLLIVKEIGFSCYIIFWINWYLLDICNLVNKLYVCYLLMDSDLFIG